MAPSACRRCWDLLTFHPDDTLVCGRELVKEPIDQSGMWQMDNRLNRVQYEIDYPMDENADPTPIQSSALAPRGRIGRADEPESRAESESPGSANMPVRGGALAQGQVNAMVKQAFKAPVAPRPTRTGGIE